MNSPKGKEKTQQMGSDHNGTWWKIVAGRLSGLWLCRKEIGTDIDGSGIYSDVMLCAGRPLTGPANAMETYPTLRAAWADL